MNPTQIPGITGWAAALVGFFLLGWAREIRDEQLREETLRKVANK